MFINLPVLYSSQGRKSLFNLFSLLITSNQSGHSSPSHGGKAFPLTGHSLVFRSFFVNLIWLSGQIPVDLFLESSEQPHLPPTVKASSRSLHLKLLSLSGAHNLKAFNITLRIHCSTNCIRGRLVYFGPHYCEGNHNTVLFKFLLKNVRS